jgi:hypothetical protein
MLQQKPSSSGSSRQIKLFHPYRVKEKRRRVTARSGEGYVLPRRSVHVREERESAEIVKQVSFIFSLKSDKLNTRITIFRRYTRELNSKNSLRRVYVI